MSRPSLLIGIVLATGLALLAACDGTPPAGSAGEVQGRLVLGLLPDENPSVQRRKYSLLTEAIHARTGLGADLEIVDSYAALVDRFAEGKVDIAYFGGYTFLAAERRASAVPLVMRDIDAQFVSYVLVREDDPAMELADLAGRPFAFGSPLSTSGHVMPRYFFLENGIKPEALFGSTRYSGAHDLTLEWIRDGEVDAGVVNGQIAHGWLARQADGARRLRVIWRSPPYVDYVWAVQPTMSERTRTAIKDAFLSMTFEDPKSRVFLEAVGARHFLPADGDDFALLRKAVELVERPAQVAAAGERAK